MPKTAPKNWCIYLTRDTSVCAEYRGFYLNRAIQVFVKEFEQQLDEGDTVRVLDLDLAKNYQVVENVSLEPVG